MLRLTLSAVLALATACASTVGGASSGDDDRLIAGPVFLPEGPDGTHGWPRVSAWTGPAGTKALAGPIVGQTTGGTWAYHFDRNALRDSRVVGNRVVVVTTSGNLLAFALGDGAPRLVAERVFAPPATVLAAGPEGGVLVGDTEGVIWRVDTTLEHVERVARVGRRLDLLALRADGALVTVFAGPGPATYHPVPTAQATVLRRVGARWSESAAFMIPSGTVWHLDRRGALWIGADLGEWGGRYLALDTYTGKLGEERGSSPVKGFAEDYAGRVRVFGGLIHLFSRRAFVTSPLDPELRADAARPNARLAGVELPIAALVEERDGSWIIAADRVIYRAPADLARLTRLGELPLRGHAGHANSIGWSSPIVHAVRLPDGRILLTTARDGLVVYDPTSSTAVGSLVPNQLEDASSVFWMSWGLVVDSREVGFYAWRAGRWTAFSPYPARSPRAPERTWSQWPVFVRLDEDRLAGVVSDGWTPGETVCLEWTGPDRPPRVTCDDPDSDRWGIHGGRPFAVDGQLWLRGPDGLYTPRDGALVRAGAIGSGRNASWIGSDEDAWFASGSKTRVTLYHAPATAEGRALVRFGDFPHADAVTTGCKVGSHVVLCGPEHMATVDLRTWKASADAAPCTAVAGTDAGDLWIVRQGQLVRFARPTEPGVPDVGPPIAAAVLHGRNVARLVAAPTPQTAVAAVLEDGGLLVVSLTAEAAP